MLCRIRIKYSFWPGKFALQADWRLPPIIMSYIDHTDQEYIYLSARYRSCRLRAPSRLIDFRSYLFGTCRWCGLKALPARHHELDHTRYRIRSLYTGHKKSCRLKVPTRHHERQRCLLCETWMSQGAPETWNVTRYIYSKEFPVGESWILHWAPPHRECQLFVNVHILTTPCCGEVECLADRAPESIH